MVLKLQDPLGLSWFYTRQVQQRELTPEKLRYETGPQKRKGYVKLLGGVVYLFV